MKEVVVPVCKEGDRSSCHIYKGMTLLSHLVTKFVKEFYVMK